MFSKHTTFNILYFLILILNIYALVIDNYLLRIVAIPLIGSSLVLYLIIKTKIEETFDKLIFAGLILSMAGDIQLLFTTSAEFYFLTAMIATLIAYLLYSLAYYIDYKKDTLATKRVGNRLMLILAICIITLYISASRNLGNFKYPIAAYLLILSAMVVLSGYRYKRVNRLSYKLILTSSMAFLISDLSIAYYNFIDEEKVMMIIFLSTYLIAQYLVVMGAIERKRLSRSS
ncbi:MAG: lysoplasmalogenase [Pyrinomonadaceae bacterium]|nr:lysoplasmalogenase [Sphingobacteriaceae bacterium]